MSRAPAGASRIPAAPGAATSGGGLPTGAGRCPGALGPAAAPPGTVATRSRCDGVPARVEGRSPGSVRRGAGLSAVGFRPGWRGGLPARVAWGPAGVWPASGGGLPTRVGRCPGALGRAAATPEAAGLRSGCDGFRPGTVATRSRCGGVPARVAGRSPGSGAVGSGRGVVGFLLGCDGSGSGAEVSRFRLAAPRRTAPDAAGSAPRATGATSRARPGGVSSVRASSRWSVARLAALSSARGSLHGTGHRPRSALIGKTPQGFPAPTQGCSGRGPVGRGCCRGRASSGRGSIKVAR